MNDNAPVEKANRPRLTRKEYTDPVEKRRDFWSGFGLWFALNIILTICSWGVTVLFTYGSATSTSGGLDTALSGLYSVLGILLSLAPWVLNLGLLIYFGLTRTQVAFGMLAAFGVVLALGLILGVVTSVGCFITSLSDSSGYAIAGQFIVAIIMAPVVVAAIVVGIIFFVNYRSSQDKYSLRMVRLIAILLGVVFVSGIILTVAYFITQAAN
jgi:hypothetical protein